MNLSVIIDWFYSPCGRIDQETSLKEGDNKDYRTNKSEKETETSEPMSVTTGRNKGISSCGNYLASSSKREYFTNILPKKKVSSGNCHSLSPNKQTPVSDNRDQRAEVNDLPSSIHDSNLNTIKSWLYRFRKPKILPTLENSLEQVKRNKVSPKSHEDLSKSIDKELQQLSRTFHPDRAGDTEWQAALNAIREILKTLTAVFLENLFIDYKYEYFSRLDVRILVNEKERNNTIQTIFCKISVFSETKRMNIIGEIHKFLIESEKCFKSFLVYNESDFLKFRDYALYHLRKNIEGYKKLERECNLLIEECSNEDYNMRTVLQNMVDRSLGEWWILRKLEQSAKSSFQGNFEIFPVQKYMDEYYILPFVDYVNVLSMCSLLLQPKRSSFFASFSEVDTEEFTTDDDRNNFVKAYSLAYDINQYKIGNKKGRKNLSIREFSQELHETLKIIFREVLQTDYTVDVYREGKSNRVEMYEQLSSVKNILKNLEEKEKAFGELVRQYQTESNEFPESVVNYKQEERISSKVDMTNREKESEEDSRKLTSPLEGGKNQCTMEAKNFSESVVNFIQDEDECFEVDMRNEEKESEKESRKLTLSLEGEENQCTMETKKISESVLNCIQDEDESFEVDMRNGEKRNEDSKKLTSTLEGEENQNKMETKSYESDLNCRQDEEVNMPMRENDRERYSSNPNSLSIGEKIPAESQESKDITWALKEGFVFLVDEVAEECLNQLD